MTEFQILKEMQKELILARKRQKWWGRILTRESLFCSGLCNLSREICIRHNSYNFDSLIDKLEQHAPKFSGNLNNSYWWKQGEVKPRLALVNYLIENWDQYEE